MFYVTIYKVTPDKPNYIYIGNALSYANKSDAEKFIKFFLDEAKAIGVETKEKDGYTYATGKFVFSQKQGGFVPFYHPITYIIGIESDEEKNLYSLADSDRSYLFGGDPCTDGFTFEADLAKYKEQKIAEVKAEKEKADRVVNNFKTQLDSASDLRSILTVLIKFSKQKIDKDLILDSVVAKIEGKEFTTSNGWYDELSEINK